MKNTENPETTPLNLQLASTFTCTAAAISPANVTQETESTSPGKPPGASTMLLPTEGRNVVKIQPKETSIRSRAPMVNALLIVAEENRARVAATNGHPWSVGQAHIDSPKSSKYGISLAAGLRVLGVGRLNRGDFVEIEVCSGNTCHQLTGRASRKAAAYYSKSDLVQAGVQVHTPFHYVVLHVVPAGQNPINVEGQL
jgi:hypothetical protein